MATTASSSSASRDFSETLYTQIDFTRLQNILPSSLKILPINPFVDLIREDQTDDSQFYSTPRFVQHIDDRARYVLSQFYIYAVKQTTETMTLDLCSSWTSHLPGNFVGLVHGLGMNESELKHNPSLNNGHTVQDLNRNPYLTQFPSNMFDSVLCTVSVDYLSRPLEVFGEIGRILKPNGQFITSFSNRCFPTKVIGRWLKMNEQQRVEWVANYFLLTDTYFDPKTVKAYSFFDDHFLPSIDGEFRDPMAIAPVRVQTQQPQSYFRPINNSFNLLPSEKVYREWEHQDNSCCCSDSYHTTLTDIRLLTRYQEYVFCASCSEPSHTDSAIFLREIDQMRECRGEQPTFFFLLWITLICAWPCYVVRRIFCPKPKCLEVFGSFGSEIVRLKQEDLPIAQVDISTAVINNKSVGRS